MTVGVSTRYNIRGSNLLIEPTGLTPPNYNDWCSYKNNILLALIQGDGLNTTAQIDFYDWIKNVVVKTFTFTAGIAGQDLRTGKGITFDGVYIYVITNDDILQIFQDTIYVLDMDGNQIRSITLDGTGAYKRITTDKKHLWLIESGGAQTANMFDYDGSKIKSFSLTAGLIYIGADFDGQYLILGNSGGTGKLEFWDLTGNKVLSTSIGNASTISYINCAAWNGIYTILITSETAPVEIE